MNHLLDLPIWVALTTRQAALAQEYGGIRRLQAEFGAFAATETGTAESFAELAELASPGEQIYLPQNEAITPPPGFEVLLTVPVLQMVAAHVESPPDDFAFEEMTEADAHEMHALAHMTRPGPFAERSHELGRFIGIRQDGRLIAMAGERLKPGTFTEISAVCTHPEHRGRGHAAGLMREIARGIVARDETPFLHVLAGNLGAISVYHRLGFIIRWRAVLTVLRRTSITNLAL